MALRRRFERLLSILFLMTGALMLSYAGFTWFTAGQTPEVIRRVKLIHPQELELPPALAPAIELAQTAVELDQSAATLLPPALSDPAAQSAPLVILPESLLDFREAAFYESSMVEKGTPLPAQPARILIPSLGVDAPVLPAALETKQSDQRAYAQWTVPNDYAAGWHESSALLGQPGNTVLNGHNNVHGAIFGDLVHLATGEQIVLISEQRPVVYRVVHHELLEENGLSLRERVQNARWIAPTEDERLTLVTCWPNTTNSHRLVVVAMPVESES